MSTKRESIYMINLRGHLKSIHNDFDSPNLKKYTTLSYVMFTNSHFGNLQFLNQIQQLGQKVKYCSHITELDICWGFGRI